MLEGRAFQLVAVPVLAPLPIGWVALGFAVDDAWRRTCTSSPTLEVSFLMRRGRQGLALLASTLAIRAAAHAARRMPAGSDAVIAPCCSIGGEDHQARVIPLSATTACASSRCCTARSSRRSRPSTAAQHTDRAGGAEPRVSIAGSLPSRAASRARSALAAAAKRIQQGDYARRSTVERDDEIGELAASFNHMLDGIESREKRDPALAYEDGLTGLPNRAMFNEQLEQAVRRRARGERRSRC